MLEWETNLHLDAVSQVLENLERLIQLGNAVDESNIFSRLLAALNPVLMHSLEVIVCRLGLGIA